MVALGAVLKDGSSAGTAMFTSLASLMLKPVGADVATTGEIAPRGLVLPIGGWKEKTLADLRARPRRQSRRCPRVLPPGLLRQVCQDGGRVGPDLRDVGFQ